MLKEGTIAPDFVLNDSGVPGKVIGYKKPAEVARFLFDCRQERTLSKDSEERDKLFVGLC